MNSKQILNKAESVLYMEAGKTIRQKDSWASYMEYTYKQIIDAVRESVFNGDNKNTIMEDGGVFDTQKLLKSLENDVWAMEDMLETLHLARKELDRKRALGEY